MQNWKVRPLPSPPLPLPSVLGAHASPTPYSKEKRTVTPRIFRTIKGRYKKIFRGHPFVILRKIRTILPEMRTFGPINIIGVVKMLEFNAPALSSAIRLSSV